MAPKRRAVSVETDTDSELPPPTNKRARTQTNLDDEPPAATTSGSHSRLPHDNVNDTEPIVVEEEEEIEEDALNADDEKKFEELHEDLIRAKLMNTSNVQGVSAYIHV